MAGKADKGLEGGAQGLPKTTGECPICSKETVRQYRPFCTRRCADLDLHNWLQGHYAIAAEEDENLPQEEISRH